MFATTNAELFKLWHRPLVWVLGALFLSLAVLLGYVFPYVTYLGVIKDSASPDEVELFFTAFSGKNIGPVTLDVVARFGGAFAVVLGALTVGSEYGWNTIKTVLTQRGNRAEALVGVLLAMAAVIASGVVMSLAASLAASLAIGVIADQQLSLPDPLATLASAGSAWLSLVAWAGIGAALAALFRSSALAASLGLVYVLGVETLVGLAAAHVKLAEMISRGLVGSNAMALAQAMVPDGVNVPVGAITEMHALAVLAVFVAAAVAVMGLLQRRDHA